VPVLFKECSASQSTRRYPEVEEAVPSQVAGGHGPSMSAGNTLRDNCGWQRGSGRSRGLALAVLRANPNQ